MLYVLISKEEGVVITLREFNYEIKKHIAVISQNGNQTLEINYISYNGRSPKIDIRRWDKTKEKSMLKGITLTNDEFLELSRVMAKMENSPALFDV